MKKKSFKLLLVVVMILSTILVACGSEEVVHESVVTEVTETEETQEATVNKIEVIKEKLEVAAELNTACYLCTDVLTRADSKEIKGWKIPLTEKSFIISYDGTVKAGIKNLAQAEVLEETGQIIIKLPNVEITSVEIDNNSFQKLDEKNNIFNPITTDDLNDAQSELKTKMQDSAMEKGILELAKQNAETILLGMLSGAVEDCEIVIEWK